ncbi:MAG: efflux RND transporter periplasmic adaptor subunit [Salinisphaeraceae bacterium]
MARLFSLLLILPLAACDAVSAPGTPPPADQPHPVETGQVRVIDTDRQFALSGVVRSADRARLAFQVGGRLVERMVDIGESVERGQLIARLAQPELAPAAEAAAARVRQLETQTDQAERDLKRVAQLKADAAATQQELESAQSRLDGLQASLAQARADASRARRLLAETRLEAPVAGTVAEILAQPGEFVSPGQPVMALSGGSGGLEVEIGLPENLLGEVAVGDRADLVMPIMGGEITGRVTELATAADGAGQLFPAVLTLDDAPDLRAGTTVTWRLRSDQPERLTVPVSAIASTGGRSQPRVFRVDDNRARSVPVTLGVVVGERVVVDADLAPGDTVVTLGLDGLVDGRAVAVRP